MRALRVIRFLLPFVLVLAIVGVLVLVFTARPDLQSSSNDVSRAWSSLEPSLDQRYVLLAAANDAVRTIPGPVRELVGEVDAGLARWRTLRQTDGSVSSKVKAANTLEALGRRLAAAGRASARVQGNAKAKGSVDAYAAAPAPPAAKSFNDAVRDYSRERSGGARPPLAAMLGYDEILAYDAATTRGSA
jgi:hypothetical protein